MTITPETHPQKPESKLKQRLVTIAIVIAVAAGGAVILLTSGQDGDAAAKPSASASPVELQNGRNPAGNGPTLSAGDTDTRGKGVKPEYEIAPDAELVPRAETPEQYKRDAEAAGMEFLKIYLNPNGAANENPLSYTDKLTPYATSGLIDSLRASYGDAKPEWNWLGEEMHQLEANVIVEGYCSLTPDQSLPLPFDEEKGGNLPCAFRQVIRDDTGTQVKSDVLGIETNLLGNQVLQVVKEDGAWKVAAVDPNSQ